MITLEPMENLRIVAKYRYHKELDDLNQRDWEALRDYIGLRLIQSWSLIDYVAEQTGFTVPRLTLKNVTYTFNTASGASSHANANTITFDFKAKI